MPKNNRPTNKPTGLRKATEPGELYAVVNKIMGGSIVNAIDESGTSIQAIIRGKFRGKRKRDNLISSGSLLLVGLQEWNSSKADILEVYNEHDKNKIISSSPHINWSKLFNYAKGQPTQDDDLVFTNDEFEFVADNNTSSHQPLVAEEINIEDI